MFSTSEIKLHQLLFDKMEFHSSDKSMSLVDAGTYAYIYFKSNLETIVAAQFTDKSGHSSMHIAKEDFFPGGYAWAFPKVSHVLPSFRNLPEGG